MGLGGGGFGCGFFVEVEGFGWTDYGDDGDAGALVDLDDALLAEFVEEVAHAAYAPLPPVGEEAEGGYDFAAEHFDALAAHEDGGGALPVVGGGEEFDEGGGGGDAALGAPEVGGEHGAVEAEVSECVHGWGVFAVWGLGVGKGFSTGVRQHFLVWRVGGRPALWGLFVGRMKRGCGFLVCVFVWGFVWSVGLLTYVGCAVAVASLAGGVPWQMLFPPSRGRSVWTPQEGCCGVHAAKICS